MGAGTGAESAVSAAGTRTCWSGTTVLRRAADPEGLWLHTAADTADDAALRHLVIGPPVPGGDAQLVLIASSHDLPVCQIQAGRALERVVLAASALGYDGTVVAGPGRLDRSRRALRAAGVDTSVRPQVLLSLTARG